MKESDFQSGLIREIKSRFPGSIVMKNDAGLKQGIPDLTVLFEDRWAALECKASSKSKHRPNQDRRVQQMNDMSYASFVYPENKEEVLDEMERAFRSKRKARVPKCK